MRNDSPDLSLLLISSASFLSVSGVTLTMLMPLIPNATARNQTTSATSAATQALSVSPLIFGTNLDLSEKRAQTFMTTPPTLQDIPVSTVRFAPPPNLDDAALNRIAEAIKRMNTVPVVVLGGNADS